MAQFKRPSKTTLTVLTVYFSLALFSFWYLPEAAGKFEAANAFSGGFNERGYVCGHGIEPEPAKRADIPLYVHAISPVVLVVVVPIYVVGVVIPAALYDARNALL